MFNRIGLAKRIIAKLLLVMITVSMLVVVDTPYVHAATTVKIAHAASGEKGTTGCKAGDQTGKEVCVRSWTYSTSSSSGLHWNAVLRCNDTAVAARIVEAAVKACKNDHIGYDKESVASRQSFYKALVEANWDPSKITKDVETSCSPFACACINAGFRRQYIKTDHSCTTLYKTLKDDPQFTCFTTSDYCTSDKYLLPGDILITTGRHCAIVVEQTAPIYTTASFKEGNSYTLTTDLRLRSGAGTNYEIKDFATLTAEEQSIAMNQSGKAVIKSGSTVKCLKTSGNWIQISCGWICGKEGIYDYVKDASSGTVAPAATPTATTKPAATTTTAKATTTTKTSSTVTVKAGRDYVLAKKLYVRKGPGTNYGIKKRSSLSKSAKKYAVSGSKAMFKKGTVVTCLEKKGNWMRVPSGWICCKPGNVKAY